MTDETIKNILGDLEYDSGREDSLRRFIASAFEARDRTYLLIAVAVTLVGFGIAASVAVLFFQTQEVRDMIFYATVFLTCIIAVATLRVFLWQMLHRQRLLREIKRLEVTIVELAQNLGRAGEADSD